MQKLLAAALTAAAVTWGVAIVAAPFLLRHPTWGAPTAIVYAGASRFCHQRPERSFHLHGTQMPVCARCAGLYLSGLVGAIAGWMFRQPATRSRLLLLLAALPTAITWSLEFAGVMPFSNLARAVAALPLGAIAGCLFIRMLRYDSRLHAAKNHHH